MTEKYLVDRLVYHNEANSIQNFSHGNIISSSLEKKKLDQVFYSPCQGVLVNPNKPIERSDKSFRIDTEGLSETPLHFIFRCKGDSVGRYRRYRRVDCMYIGYPEC